VQTDEQNKRVKTDALDAGALCSGCRATSMAIQGTGIIRVPTAEENNCGRSTGNDDAGPPARTKLQAQGRSLLSNYGQPTLARWWRKAGWHALAQVLPAWLLERLAGLLSAARGLDEHDRALTAHSKRRAVRRFARGLGKPSPP